MDAVHWQHVTLYFFQNIMENEAGRGSFNRKTRIEIKQVKNTRPQRKRTNKKHLGKESWRGCEQQDTSTVALRRRQQHGTELDVDKSDRPAAYIPPARTTRFKSTRSQHWTVLSMSGFGTRGPRIEPALQTSFCVFQKNYCNMQLWAQAAHLLQCLGQLKPSAL